MKNTVVLGAIVLGLTISPLMAGPGNSKNSQGWSQEKLQSGHLQQGQKKPMTETDLLLRLDKEERKMFRNLPYQTRQEVLELVNQSGTRDYKRAINEAIERQNLKVERDQERMLHNGMDRLL